MSTVSGEVVEAVVVAVVVAVAVVARFRLVKGLNLHNAGICKLARHR